MAQNMYSWLLNLQFKQNMSHENHFFWLKIHNFFYFCYLSVKSKLHEFDQIHWLFPDYEKNSFSLTHLEVLFQFQEKNHGNYIYRW